ncbi:MAG: serpin family protein [Verrucomicrobiaceae bacterium]|nr:serpin family protein [Verrucomicrobiaceae bacterium]
MKLAFVASLFLVGTGLPSLADEAPDVLVAPGLEMDLPPDKTVVWTAAFPACWWKLAEFFKISAIDLNPPSVWGKRLNALQLDYNAVLPADAAYVGAGLASKELQESIQSEMMKRMGGRMPGLDLDWGNLIPGSVVACCWLKQRFDFDPKFYRAQSAPLAFTTASGKKLNVQYFGTTEDLASRYSQVVKILEDDNEGTVLQFQSARTGERLLFGKRLRKSDGRPVALLSEAVSRFRTQLDAYAKAIAADEETKLGAFGHGDVLKIPVVSFEGSANYTKILAGTFSAPGYKRPMRFVHAWQMVKFDLDETGAAIESRALAVASPAGGAPLKPPQPRIFIFDEPFFIAAWRDKAPLPYFMGRIDGASVLRAWSARDKP